MPDFYQQRKQERNFNWLNKNILGIITRLNDQCEKLSRLTMNTYVKYLQRKKQKIGCKVNSAAVPCGEWLKRIKAMALAAGGEGKPAARGLLEFIHRKVFIQKYTF